MQWDYDNVVLDPDDEFAPVIVGLEELGLGDGAATDAAADAGMSER